MGVGQEREGQGGGQGESAWRRGKEEKGKKEGGGREEGGGATCQSTSASLSLEMLIFH